MSCSNGSQFTEESASLIEGLNEGIWISKRALLIKW